MFVCPFQPGHTHTHTHTHISAVKNKVTCYLGLKNAGSEKCVTACDERRPTHTHTHTHTHIHTTKKNKIKKRERHT